MDVTEAEKFLEDNNIICLQNSIQNTYKKLQPNYIYHKPNFFICAPIYEKEYTNCEDIYETDEDTNINVN